MNLDHIDYSKIEKDKFKSLLLDICMIDANSTTREMFKDLVLKDVPIQEICRKYKKNPSTISCMRKRVTDKIKKNKLSMFLLKEYYGI